MAHTKGTDASSEEELKKLRMLIMDTAKTLGMRVEDDTDLSKMLERIPMALQRTLQHGDASELFDDNELADCTIRVRICAADDQTENGEGPSDGAERSRWASTNNAVMECGAASALRSSEGMGNRRAMKRSRINNGGDKATGTMRPRESTNDKSATGVVRSIRAHSAILVTHSKYFRACLRPPYLEGSLKVVDVQVASEQEVEDLELLIKLVYGPSYVMLGSCPLEKGVLLRLLPLADSFEFLGFLDACIDSLCENLTANEAFECLEAVPQTLWADDRFRKFLQDAADVVANGLGYLDELFEPGPVCHSGEQMSSLCLKAAGQALPPFFIKGLIANERLKVRSENDTFALAMACLDYHVQHGNLTEPEAQTYCNDILPQLRYHRMSPHFLSSVVALHPRVALSGHLPDVMAVSLSHRENTAHLVQEWADEHFGPRDRGENLETYSVSGAFSMIDFTTIEKGGSIFRWVGMAQGYPVGLTIGRRSGGSIFVEACLGFPRPKWLQNTALSWLRVDVTSYHTGLTEVAWWSGLVHGGEHMNLEGCFNEESYVDVVLDGSPYFSEGEVRFEVDVSFPTEVARKDRLP